MGARDDAKRDAGGLPANLMRTMPYTSYVAVASYAITFASSRAGWLMLALLLNEVFNAALKKFLTLLVGCEAILLRRPVGAMDSGIYPQHFPTESHTSGMPSGHSQTSAFLATLLTFEVLHPSCGSPGEYTDSCSEQSSAASTALRLCFLWLLALCVMTSRTRFGGVLSVKVSGRIVAHHTVMQVVVGGCLGVALGFAARNWYDGQSWWPWFLLAVGIVVVTLCAAYVVEEYLYAPCSAQSDKEVADSESVGDKSTEGGSSDPASSAAEIEMRDRSFAVE